MACICDPVKAPESPWRKPARDGSTRPPNSQPATDSYRIALTWDETNWTEEVLKNLQDKGVELTPLSVDVIKLAQLRELIKIVYDSLGVEVMNDDD